MPICSSLRGLAAVAVICAAAPAFAFDATSISPDTPPADALKFGLTSYKSGDKVSAIEALSFAAGKLLLTWLDSRLDATEGVLKCPPGGSCDNVNQLVEVRQAMGNLARNTCVWPNGVPLPNPLPPGRIAPPGRRPG